MKLRTFLLPLIAAFWLTTAPAHAVVDGSCNYTAGNGTALGFIGCNEELAAIIATPDDDVPEAGDFGNLATGVGISNSGGTLLFDFSDAGASPVLGADECRFTSNATVPGNLVCEGDVADGFESRIAITAPTVDRTLTVPDADSNSVQPLACSGSDKVSGISALGVITCAVDNTGSVSDGDKGDVVVSIGGTVWDVEANAVTNLILSNMPTATLKGRIAAGTGDPEDLTALQARLLSGSSLTPFMFNAVGDGVADDTAEWQAAIDHAETLMAAGASHVVIDGQGLNYGISNQLINDGGMGLTITNAKFSALASANWSATNYSAAQIPDLIRTNLVLWNRDLTNAAWTKVTMTAAKTATDIDGNVNSATRLTATGANATIKQSITSASALRVHTAFVKRVTGTGNIDMTMDDGATWTTLASPAPETTKYTQYRIPEQTLANPIVGFRIATSGDEIEVDLVQNEAADGIPVATPPMLTTTAAVTRVVPATYMLRFQGSATSPLVHNVQFDANNLTGGVYLEAFSAHVDHCRFEEIAGVGIKQEAGGVRVTFNLLAQSTLPSGRGGIGIYAAQADGKFFGNIARYSAWPFYFGQSEVGSEWGSTGLWGGNHAYNGNASGPDSGNIYYGSGANSNVFQGGYLDNGGVHLRGTDVAFWNNRLTWNANTHARSVFTYWTATAGDSLANFLFSGLEYSSANLASTGATLHAFRTTGAGTWAGINSAVIAALDGGAQFSEKLPSIVSNNTDLGKMIGRGTGAYLSLYDLTTVVPPKLGVLGDDLLLQAPNIRISNGGTSPDVLIDDQGSLTLQEEDANGSNFLRFTTPAAIASNRTCALIDSASFIPESCVGEGDSSATPDIFKVLTANETALSSASGQAWFPTNGAVTVEASTTYLVEGMLNLSNGTTSHTTGINFAGTATITNWDIWVIFTSGAVNTTQPSNSAAGTSSLYTAMTLWSGTTAMSTNQVLNATSVLTGAQMRIKGIVRTNAAGTIIPRFQWSANPTGTNLVLRNSWFSMTKLGTSTFATKGTWN